MFLHAKTSTFHRSFQTDDIVKNREKTLSLSVIILLLTSYFFLSISFFLIFHVFCYVLSTREDIGVYKRKKVL